MMLDALYFHFDLPNDPGHYLQDMPANASLSWQLQPMIQHKAIKKLYDMHKTMLQCLHNQFQAH